MKLDSSTTYQHFRTKGLYKVLGICADLRDILTESQYVLYRSETATEPLTPCSDVIYALHTEEEIFYQIFSNVSSISQRHPARQFASESNLPIFAVKPILLSATLSVSILAQTKPKVFLRPLSMFIEQVEHEGLQVSRFQPKVQLKEK
jgi:hypothetical protein